MTALRRVSIALPSHPYSTEEILAGTVSWLDDEKREFFTRMLLRSKVACRRFALPLERIIGLEGVETRAALFRAEGLALATSAVRELLTGLCLSPASIDTLIFTSCSAPIIPTLDTMLIDSLPLPRTIRRIPLYQYGCIGGASGLSLARSTGRTLLVSVELCSLVFQGRDGRKGNLVGSALFGDGCAAAYLGDPTPGAPDIVDSLSYVIPDSTDLMGYELLDDGAHLSLDREIPRALGERLPALVSSFLARNGLAPTDIRFWLPHPGGAGILERLEAAFDLDPEDLRWSWRVLSNHGNMSSATLLYVLHEFMADLPTLPSGHALVIGVGPGLVVELLLLRV